MSYHLSLLLKRELCISPKFSPNLSAQSSPFSPDSRVQVLHLPVNLAVHIFLDLGQRDH